jgi:hypothetical protein
LGGLGGGREDVGEEEVAYAALYNHGQYTIHENEDVESSP